jgi:hypothetical protein
MKTKWKPGVRISSEARRVFNDTVSATETEGSYGFICPYLFCEGTFFKFSQDSVVGISTGYGIDVSGFESWHEQPIVLFSKTFRPNLKPNQPPLQEVLVAKLLGNDVDHSLPSNAEFKN